MSRTLAYLEKTTQRFLRGQPLRAGSFSRVINPPCQMRPLTAFGKDFRCQAFWVGRRWRSQLRELIEDIVLISEDEESAWENMVVYLPL